MVHQSGRLHCPQRDCKANFLERAAWMAHQNSAHASARAPLCWKHQCNGRQFSTVDELFEHQKEMSTTDFTHQCLICGADFPTENARDRHISYGTCSGQFEVPVLRVSRPVSMCVSCRRRRVKCNGKIPCTPYIEKGQVSDCANQKPRLFQKERIGDFLLPELKAEENERTASAKTFHRITEAALAPPFRISRKLEGSYHLAKHLESRSNIDEANLTLQDFNKNSEVPTGSASTSEVDRVRTKAGSQHRIADPREPLNTDVKVERNEQQRGHGSLGGDHKK